MLLLVLALLAEIFRLIFLLVCCVLQEAFWNIVPIKEKVHSLQLSALKVLMFQDYAKRLLQKGASSLCNEIHVLCPSLANTRSTLTFYFGLKTLSFSPYTAPCSLLVVLVSLILNYLRNSGGFCYNRIVICSCHVPLLCIYSLLCLLCNFLALQIENWTNWKICIARLRYEAIASHFLKFNSSHRAKNSLRRQEKRIKRDEQGWRIFSLKQSIGCKRWGETKSIKFVKRARKVVERNLGERGTFGKSWMRRNTGTARTDAAAKIAAVAFSSIMSKTGWSGPLSAEITGRSKILSSVSLMNAITGLSLVSVFAFSASFSAFSLLIFSCRYSLWITAWNWPLANLFDICVEFIWYDASLKCQLAFKVNVENY